jgi:D-beta-D-heptose 7-phosphate kinase / D-beta-D-heptose 1-phosphate adenosyltransferase
MAIVLCTGHFNILHVDHCRLFKFASTLGIVVVGINGDVANKNKYGERSVSEEDRQFTLLSCRYVDQVMVFHEDHPGELIRKIKPDFFVRGPDYNGIALPEQSALNDAGTTLVIDSHRVRVASSSELTGIN